MKNRERIIIEFIIGALLVLSTWSMTKYYRSEQIFNLQAELQTLDNGIKATTNILNRGIQNGGKINLQALINLGWDLQSKPILPKPDSPPQQ